MELYLSYEYFQTNAAKTFQGLWNDQNYSDVILATGDDKVVRAHKIILCSNSAFFRNIFDKYPHQNPFIYLKDIKYKYLNWVLEFIYTGKCDVEEPELVKFLSVGKELGVNGLMAEIVNDANIAMEDDVSEEQSNEEVENGSKQTEVTSKDTSWGPGL